MRPALWLLALAAGPAAADPLQDRLLADMRATRTDDVAVTITSHNEQTGSAAHDRVVRYDGHGGWTLASIDGHAPTPAQQAKSAEHRHQPPGYAHLLDYLGGPATRVAASGSTVTYRFDHLPAGAVKFGSRDISAMCTAEAVVETGGAKPYVARVRFGSTAPFHLMLVARVDRFQSTSTFAPLPDGRIYPVGVETLIAGAMMGKSGTLTNRTRYSDAHPAR